MDKVVIRLQADPTKSITGTLSAKFDGENAFVTCGIVWEDLMGLILGDVLLYESNGFWNQDTRTFTKHYFVSDSSNVLANLEKQLVEYKSKLDQFKDLGWTVGPVDIQKNIVTKLDKLSAKLEEQLALDEIFLNDGYSSLTDYLTGVHAMIEYPYDYISEQYTSPITVDVEDIVVVRRDNPIGAQLTLSEEEVLSIFDISVTDNNKTYTRREHYVPEQELEPLYVTVSRVKDAGVFLKTECSFDYFSNKQEICSLTNIIDSQQVRFIYEYFESEIVRLARISYYEENIVVGPYRDYIEYETPNNEIGVPFLGDVLNPSIEVNNEYFHTYIDHVAEILKCINDHDLLYPEHPITIEQRFRDSKGYYFLLRSALTKKNRSGFAKMQMEYLDKLLYILTSFDLNAEEILTYARETWKM